MKPLPVKSTAYISPSVSDTAQSDPIRMPSGLVPIIVFGSFLRCRSSHLNQY